MSRPRRERSGSGHASLVRLGCAIVVAWVFSAGVAGSQELARTVRVTADNDYFNFWRPPLERPDDNYTQGVRLTWDLSSAPRLVHRWLLGADAANGSTVEIGQEIYTPFISEWPVAGDRPYAGWLYGRYGVRSGTPDACRIFDLTVGWTGPLSLAQAAQETFHRMAGFRQPRGWARQLPTEVSVGIRAAQSWRVRPSSAIGDFVDLVPTVRLGVGTLRTAAFAGTRARLGWRLPHPWLAGEVSGLEPYSFAGVGVDAVARDLFLDGTLFRPSVRADRERVVGEWEWGVGVRMRRLSLEYRAVTRTREYRLGPPAHTFGSLTLSWSLQ